jgi:hypothetical protein
LASARRLHSKCSLARSKTAGISAPYERGAGAFFDQQEDSMNRPISLTLVLLAVTTALSATAQESGGLRLSGTPSATLKAIDANRGCPLSRTSVTVGVNKAFGTSSSATQQLGTAAGNARCRPLVSTQVAAGVNLALGSGSQAGQSIAVQGQSGALASIGFTHGVNAGVGTGSVAAQRIQNLTDR